jgi:hypothetical protein
MGMRSVFCRTPHHQPLRDPADGTGVLPSPLSLLGDPVGVAEHLRAASAVQPSDRQGRFMRLTRFWEVT